MGRLADDMARLSGDIRASRDAREVFVNELKLSIAAMMAGFCNDRVEMNKNMKIEREYFIFHVKRSVANLRRTVAGLRREISNDITGARRIWSGPSPAQRRAKEEAERRRAEVERKAREEAERQRAEAERQPIEKAESRDAEDGQKAKEEKSPLSPDRERKAKKGKPIKSRK
jgi:hypothetical protein